MPVIGFVRSFGECFTVPVGRCLSHLCPCDHFSACEDLPEMTELGPRESALFILGMCSRLVGGMGYIDQEFWGKFDPPLNAEGWEVREQVCETGGSDSAIQAAMYANKAYPNVYIVAYRGTATAKGLWQDASLYLAYKGSPIRRATREAQMFFSYCYEKYGGDAAKFFVTGHSLGGYIAEVVASKLDVDGAVFNNPGPWQVRVNIVKNNAGICRPNFEVHLTRDDPIAVMFPKPENSCHISYPFWHEGKNHRFLDPYVQDQSDYKGLLPNTLPPPGPGVDQFREIRALHGSESESDDEEEEDGGNCC